MTHKIGVVGAGFSGAVISRELAKAGFQVEVIEARNHVAGNCHTARDPETGVLVHQYGPHIFHTNDDRVWNYIRQFDTFIPYTNRVKAVSNGTAYSFPINLLTLNSYFKKNLSPNEAKQFLTGLCDTSILQPKSLEEQALRYLGKDLYEAFFKGYTLKQWGMSPSELPASILKRLPIRFNYDDNYYTSKYQGMPKNGYTHIIERMLDHPAINLILNKQFSSEMSRQYRHIFYSGPLDAWFSHSAGRLRYRTLDFAVSRHEGDYQGNAVINYCDEAVPWTRVSEHKHFAPWEDHQRTIVYHEHSRECGLNDIPYYPVRLISDKSNLVKYINLAASPELNVTFVGRLGTYRYLDMHVTIAEALETAKAFISATRKGRPAPRFSQDPLTN